LTLLAAPIEIRRSIPRWALPLIPPTRYKGASGGRASGKSHFFAEQAVEDMVCDPALRFVCIREVQRSLKFSAKSLVESKIRKMGVPHLFDVLSTEIRRKNGSGVMIFEGMQDHTADSIKSLEGFGRAWVEEAQSISERSLSLLLPTIRADNSEIWFSWNPEQPTDPVDLFFAGKPTGSAHVHTTYLDNPFCPDVMRTEATRLRDADVDSHEHVWMGGYFLGGNGRVYSSFLNRAFPLGNVDESIVDTGGDLYVGQDFNVNPMASVIAVRAVDECHVIDAIELATSNTEEVATEIRRRYPNRRVIFCPDPAGNARHTNAPVGQTDFSILRKYGFEVRAPNAHPPVVDRINNAQSMLNDVTTGRRRLRIHPKARALITGLSNLTYKEGTSQPDKRSGFDHICDAMGYLLWQEFNVLAIHTSSVDEYVM
jgi:PBSX family phage terminase large subunit